MTDSKLIMQSAFGLQLVWVAMYLTNSLGFIGTRSVLLLDVMWLGIAALGIIVSIAFLWKQQSKVLAAITLTLSLGIIFLWILVTGISKM